MLNVLEISKLSLSSFVPDSPPLLLSNDQHSANMESSTRLTSVTEKTVRGNSLEESQRSDSKGYRNIHNECVPR